ncbi:MAG: dihydrolipoyl dehydrogenase [Planctomycetota bacterium]|jgi:dihydrolipoamide dehydrogenase|nr:dihydrolipoyl dehydrogenase [Planctomycetota bacterium]
MYDLIILGAGPAGYVAAEHAGRLGRTTLLIEKDLLGGVCLNCGCVPTKSFLHSAKLYAHALHSEAFGVAVKEARFDYGKMKARTEKIQDTLRNGVAGMMKRHKVEVVVGDATVESAKAVRVGDTVHEGANLLLASGSSPAHPPIPGLAGNPYVVDSTGMLSAGQLVDHLAVIGGGVIGIEFASFYALAGKKATVLEMLPQICGSTDKELAAILQRKLESMGVSIHVGAKVVRVEGDVVHFEDKNGKTETVKADMILSATGRKANVDGLGCEKINLDFDKRGIRVNERAETNVPGVYAAGDVTGRIQLAHFASRQGIVAVNNMFGHPDICREDAIPGVIYSDPEIAGVGLTEAQAKERGIECKTLKMPLAASGRFLAETEGGRGVVKAVVGARGEVLGMHVVGSYASEMIGAAAIMIEAELRARDVQDIVFPHPTVSEIMRDVMFMY